MGRIRGMWRRARHVWTGTEGPARLSADSTAVDTLVRFQKSHHLIDPFHKVVYCYVAKNACSTFKFHFQRKKLSAANVAMSDTDIRRQNHALASKHAISRIPDDLFKDHYVYFIARHPAARICSAFLDKFVQNDTLPPFVRQFMVKGGNGDNLAKWTFADFVHCIARANVESLNEHWMPQYLHLIEGVDYDFIPIESCAAHPRLRSLYGDLTGRIGRHSLRYFDTDKPMHRTPASELRQIFKEQGRVPTWRSFIQPELEDDLKSVFGPDYDLYEQSKAATAHQPPQSV